MTIPETDATEQQAPAAPFVPEKKESAAKKATVMVGRSEDPNFVGKSQQFLQQAKKVKIIVTSTESSRDDVPVSVNGYVYQIKRDVEVEVPLAVLEVLDHATMTVYDQKKREDGEGLDMIPREVMRYPYRVVMT